MQPRPLHSLNDDSTNQYAHALFWLSEDRLAVSSAVIIYPHAYRIAILHFAFKPMLSVIIARNHYLLPARLPVHGLFYLKTSSALSLFLRRTLRGNESQETWQKIGVSFILAAFAPRFSSRVAFVSPIRCPSVHCVRVARSPCSPCFPFLCFRVLNVLLSLRPFLVQASGSFELHTHGLQMFVDIYSLIRCPALCCLSLALRCSLVCGPCTSHSVLFCLTASYVIVVKFHPDCCDFRVPDLLPLPATFYLQSTRFVFVGFYYVPFMLWPLTLTVS